MSISKNYSMFFVRTAWMEDKGIWCEEIPMGHFLFMLFNYSALPHPSSVGGSEYSMPGSNP